MKEKIKLVSLKKLKSNKKKYIAEFEITSKTGKKRKKSTKFGASGMSDFTIHKDRERRERYIARHKKDLSTNDPMRPGYLSMYILWNKPTVKASLADYKRRLSVYNRTGKFPKGITGSKKLSFGAKIPFDETSMKKLPEDVQHKIQKEVSASDIQKKFKSYKMSREQLVNSLKKNAQIKYKRNPNENKRFLQKLWLNLDPTDEYTADWLMKASQILTKDDFDFTKENFWWKIIKSMLIDMEEIEMEGALVDILGEPELNYYETSVYAIVILLNRCGYKITLGNTGNPSWASYALDWWRSKKTNAFGAKIPFDQTSMKALPPDMQNIIQERVYADEVLKKFKQFPHKKLMQDILKSCVYEVKDNKGNVIEKLKAVCINNPYGNIEPDNDESSDLIVRAGKILTSKDLENPFWYNFLLYIVGEFEMQDPNNDVYLEDSQVINWKKSEKATIKMLEKIDYHVSLPNPNWYNRALTYLQSNEPVNNFGKSNVPNNVVNKKLYETIKKKIKKDVNKKGRRWGAYDSGRLVREYKEKGGKYTGNKNTKSKTSSSNLDRWYKEKWVDACVWPKKKSCGRTKASIKSKVTYCRPSKIVNSSTPKTIQELTKAQIKSRCSKKSKNPKKIIRK